MLLGVVFIVRGRRTCELDGRERSMLVSKDNWRGRDMFRIRIRGSIVDAFSDKPELDVFDFPCWIDVGDEPLIVRNCMR